MEEQTTNKRTEESYTSMGGPAVREGRPILHRGCCC